MTEATGNENPLDIDGNKFNPDLYLEKLMKHANLKQIMDKETEIVTQSQFLHSEMQTLVYENYNKFISATETVRKMRSDFKVMQEEMNKLTENMNKITHFSAQISESLKESGNNVNRLCGTRQLLDKLQFLFLLPTQLNKAIEEGRYADAVHDYTHAQRVLQKYGNQPSFQSIQTECSEIILKLKKILRERLLNPDTSAFDLVESVGLLRQLQETDSSLHDIFLSCAESRLNTHLQVLKALVNTTDILEWVEKCNNFLLTDVAIVMTCYHESFQEKGNTDLPDFADKVLMQVFQLFEDVTKRPENNGTEILIRGLDKFFRKVQAMNDIISSNSTSNMASNIVIQCIKHKAIEQQQSIRAQFKDNLTRVRQALASKGTENIDLKDILNSLREYLMQKIKASLLELQAFQQSNLSFGLKPWCSAAVEEACRIVSDEALGGLATTVRDIAAPHSTAAVPHDLLLVLARLCLDLRESSTDTNAAAAADGALAAAAQTALDGAVRAAGGAAAQMLRVSVLARDWLRAPEPRGPRAVCRRVLESLGAADAAAAQLFAGGARCSSDGSRRSVWARTQPRLFAERIEVFAPATADRAGLAEAALRIALKALGECVRLRTFGRHGLQQLQVDAHFLSSRLAAGGGGGPRADRVLHALLEDALASARARCVDPQLMEPSIVDVICERG